MTQVYAADTAALASRTQEALALLTPERRARALRLPPGEARLLSITGGLLLRHFLGDAPLWMGARGKPFLPGGPEFSLSHSGALAVLALSPRPVGLDAERCRSLRWAVAERVLTPEELLWLKAGEESRFFWLWTRKEAVMKADGLGFALPPRSFSVLPGQSVAAHGHLYAPETQTYGDYTVSLATADGESAFRITPVEPDTLLA